MKKNAFTLLTFSLSLLFTSCGGASSSSGSSTPQNAPTFSLELFNEINEKIDVAQKSLGNLASSMKSGERISRKSPNYGLVDQDPYYFYETADIPTFVNKQQQMLYIVSIVNFVREHLLNSSYGVPFEYGVLYEGEAFMETIYSLNDPIRQYHGPTPVLKLRFTYGDDYLAFESNWDYQSDFMREKMSFWNMRILSNVKFVFDEEEKIKQIWVNYNFEGSLAFACSTCLFDYENECFYSYFAGNNNGEMVTFTDPHLINQSVYKINSGTATHDNLVFCSNVEIAKAKLSLDAKADDYVSFTKRISRLDITDLSQFMDWSPLGYKELFDTLYDEVYSKTYGFKISTNFSGVNGVKVDSLIKDASNYAYWRSYFIYDNVNYTTYIPFLEREELIKHLNELKEVCDDNLDLDLDNILNSEQAGEEKYLGNYFVSDSDKYELVLSSEDTSYLFKDNLITYKCSGGFSYELHKNDVKLIRFSIIEGIATLIE